MAKKKEYSPIEFAIKDGEFAGKYQISSESMHIPSVGIIQASDLAKDGDMLSHLVSINSGVIEKIK